MLKLQQLQKELQLR